MQLKKYPVYEYDEPATYDDFKGGINLDPTSENLADNEMRDCINMEYSHVTLRKRKGAKRLCRLVSEHTFTIIQGIYLFTEKESFIILAADGKLYYSLYVPGVDLELSLLPVYDVNSTVYSETNVNLSVIKQFSGLEELTNEKDNDFKHDGYVLKSSNGHCLIFQNRDRVEFASYNNKVYVATGTRIVVIETTDNGVSLSASCVAPKILDGNEFDIYGENFMSPHPYQCIQSAVGATAKLKNILIECEADEDVYADSDPSKKIGHRVMYKCSAIMIYKNGLSLRDYYFQWKLLDATSRDTIEEKKEYQWRIINSFANAKTKVENRLPNDVIHLCFFSFNTASELGMTQEELDEEIKTIESNLNASDNYYSVLGNVKDISIECTFAENIQKTKEEDQENIDVALRDEYEAIIVDGSMSNAFKTTITEEQLGQVSATWLKIQTCRNVLIDGNKFIFYNDAYNSGEWFKTFIDKPDYISNRGCLNFKTTKNERLIKVVHFKGVLVAFSYNKFVGGNIAIVSGNGDDDSEDSSYSPYVRRVVNQEITCDTPETVQITENMLFFKFRDTIYAIEGSDISSEIITLYSMNDKLRMKHASVEIPWREECYSEITNDYYALIWREKIEYVSGEVMVTRPAMRLKMYYRIGQTIDNKVFFPWLRDEGDVFNDDGVLYIDGVSTHLRNMELLQYEDEEYTDNGKHYDCCVKLKAYDLNYPKFNKFIRNATLFYHRPSFGQTILHTLLKNESGHSLFEASSTDVALQDLETIHDGTTVGKLGKTLADTKIYNPQYMFPLLQASLEMYIICDTAFVFNSVTFNYYTTDVPDTDRFNEYSRIVRKTKPINLRQVDMGNESVAFINDDFDDESGAIQYSYDTTNQSYFVLTGKEPLVRAEAKKYIYVHAGNPIDRVSGLDDDCRRV